VTVYPLRLRGPVNRSRDLLICASIAASAAGLLLGFGPVPADAEVHLYRTYLFEHGALVWDNLWYSGDFPFATYSLLYYFPASWVGNPPLVVGAVVASTILFASVARREWSDPGKWPARAFAVFAAAPLFTGLYTYALGLTMLLAALRALQVRRMWLSVVAAAICLGFSPLAFGFLLLVLGSVLAARRRLSRSSLALGVAMAGLAGFELLVLRLFPTGGVYPFHLVNLAGVLTVCVAGAVLARRARGGAPLLAFFLLWGFTSAAAWVVATPIGGNWTRLSEIVFPVMLLTASLAGFRPRKLVVLALASALAYNLAPPLLLVPYRLDDRPAAESFWQPALGYLDRHVRPDFRVEVVPTSGHWEAYWIPHAGFALARGWYRQLDMTDNAVLYSKNLDVSIYEGWLRSNAVEYVLLPETELDPFGGPREAAILRDHPRGLVRVFHRGDWTIYRLRRPTPLLTGRGRPNVVSLGHTTIRGVVTQPGRYLLRVHYNALWTTSPGACLTPGPRGMSWLDASKAGRFTLSAPSAAVAFVRALTGERPCAGTDRPQPRRISDATR
jgi:hypothetical protein